MTEENAERKNAARVKLREAITELLDGYMLLDDDEAVAKFVVAVRVDGITAPTCWYTALSDTEEMAVDSVVGLLDIVKRKVQIKWERAMSRDEED